MEVCRENINAMASGKKNPVVFKKKVFFKGFRKATQMKTTPWLPNWSTWWLLKKKIHISAEVSCRLAELWSADTGLSPHGSAGSSKALLMSHMSRCLHYGSVRVCSANKNTDTPANFSGLKHSWEKSAVGTRKEESTVLIAPAAGSACVRGGAAFYVVLTFEACEV